MNFNFEYLKHGKALCGKAFKRFVETFNFHNDFIANLKGDADLPRGSGHVNVDTTNPSHPVIRCNGCEGSNGEALPHAPSPFEFTAIPQEEGEEEESTGTPAIVNNTFYWGGALKSLPDFTPPETCTVYLCCTREAQSEESGEQEWQFELATSPAQAPSGGSVVNYKLYDIENNNVTMDYRTTFLALNPPHEEISVTGTDEVTVKGSYIVFKSEEDSNVKVTCENDENGGVVVKIGVYYR